MGSGVVGVTENVGGTGTSVCSADGLVLGAAGVEGAVLGEAVVTDGNTEPSAGGSVLKTSAGAHAANSADSVTPAMSARRFT